MDFISSSGVSTVFTFHDNAAQVTYHPAMQASHGCVVVYD
jgi:hypothetical protein